MHLRSSLICICALFLVFLYGYKGDDIYSFLSNKMGTFPDQVVSYAQSALSAIGFTSDNKEAPALEGKQTAATKSTPNTKPNQPENRFANLHGAPPKNANDKQALYFDRLREQVKERQANANEDEMMDNEPEEEASPQDNDETIEPIADPYAQFKRPAGNDNQSPQPFIDAEDAEPEELEEDTEVDAEPEAVEDEAPEEEPTENEDL